MDDQLEMYLTARETQVLTMVACGLSAKSVAKRLGIAPSTVERHIENVRLKTRTRNRAHMIAVALRDGWLVDFSEKVSESTTQFA
jgi:LuxR family transcriptional regulator of spore coat protein